MVVALNRVAQQEDRRNEKWEEKRTSERPHWWKKKWDLWTEKVYIFPFEVRIFGVRDELLFFSSFGFALNRSCVVEAYIAWRCEEDRLANQVKTTTFFRKAMSVKIRCLFSGLTFTLIILNTKKMMLTKMLNTTLCLRSMP